MRENPEANSFFVSPRTMGTADSVPLRDLVDEDDLADDPAAESSEEKTD